MAGQVVGEVEAVQLDVDEVHAQGELVRVQHPVLVDIRQSPHLGQHRVRQARLYHLLLRHRAGDLPLGGAQRLENLVPLPPLLGDDPVRFSCAKINSWNDGNTE